jgi:hypothetical protein
MDREQVDRGDTGDGVECSTAPGECRSAPRIMQGANDGANEDLPPPAAELADDGADEDLPPPAADDGADEDLPPPAADDGADEDLPPPAAELAKQLAPSSKRVQSWQDLRTWERDKAQRQRDYHGSLKGFTVVKARDEGRMRPYYAGVLKRAAGWWKDELPAQLIAMVGWVLMGHKLGRPGVVLAHRHVGELQGVSKRTAGTWMRRAAKAGLIVRQTNYMPNGKGHRQLANTYRPSGQLVALVGRLTHGKPRSTLAAAHPPPTPTPYQGGKDCHPTKNSCLQQQIKGEDKVSAPNGAESNRSQRLRKEGAAAQLVRQLTGARLDEDIASDVANAWISFQRVSNTPAT